MPAARLIPRPASARAERRGRWGLAFGQRTFVLLLIGLVWLGPAWMDARFAFGMLAWDVVVLALWVVDLGQLPRAELLEFRRLWNSAVALSTRSQVQLALTNFSTHYVRVTGWDDVPPGLAPLPAEFEVAARAAGEGATTYAIQPNARGDARFGGLHIRYQSRWRLAERWATVPLVQTVRVYPNLDEAKRNLLYLIRSRQVDLEKRLVRRRGLGREFESLREYRQGDEWRDICWTATARRAKLIAKQYQVERSQTMWIVVDAGRLLRARVGGLAKLDYAVNAALSLAQVALYSGDRVGFIAYGRKVQQRAAAARGAAHVRLLVEQLAQVKAEPVEADHGAASDLLLHVQKPRSLVVWITDLAETAIVPEVVQSAGKLMPRHLVLFAAMGQPDLNAAALRRPDTEAEMFRAAAAQEVMQRRELLLRSLRAQGALTLEVQPGKLSTALVNHYLEIKDRALL